MAGVSNCMKYSMFIFNFLFWVCGSVILGVSIWIRVSIDDQQEINSNMLVGANLLIAVGSIIMVLGFLGCCGAIKESRCMLLLFFIGLLLILILQIAGGILGAVYRSQIEEAVKSSLQQNVYLLQSSSEEAKEFQESFQKFEQMNQCCGLVNGPTDWGKNFNTAFGSSKACECEQKDPPKDLCVYFQSRYVYKTPCEHAIIKYLKENLLIIMGIAFGLAAIEILGLVFSMSLYCQIQRK